MDRGSQYRSGIFYHDDKQRRLAEESKLELERSGVFDKPIVTEITMLKEFYKAEDYHQDYYKNHKYRYKFYRQNSGRDQFLKKTWSNKKKMDSRVEWITRPVDPLSLAGSCQKPKRGRCAARSYLPHSDR